MKQARQAAPDNIEGPAVVTALHVRDRAFRNDAGQIVNGQTAWRERTHLEAYFQQGRLGGGNPKFNPEIRLRAGLDYAELHDAWRPAGRDSTQAMNGSRSTNSDGARVNASDAGRKIAIIHANLGEKDRAICLRVLGEGYSPAEAVRTVCEDYRDTVSARFREALDSLTTAFDRARRDGWKTINMERRGA